MMNCVKSALLSGHRPHYLAAAAAASYHSTPVLQRKRKTQWHWHHRFNYYTKRRRNRETKRTMLQKMSEYAELRSTSSRNSRRAHSENSRNWSYETDNEDEVSALLEVSFARQALGLSTSGSLKLEDVKSAYRTCALRWHPDRHNGSSKAEAEEKFKHCSAAYKTLCNSLVTA